MTIADFVIVLPCKAGCTNPVLDGSEPIPTPGVHGGYCQRCFTLTETALKAAAPLVAHLLRQVGGLRSKPSGGGEMHTKAVTAPMPMNVSAFDDANEVFRLLTGWSGLLGGPRPTPGLWRDRAGNVVGLPNGITALQGRQETAALTNWFIARLETIFAEGEEDQVGRFRADMARIRRINLKWPTEDKPTFSKKTVCADDGEPLLIVPPRDFGADRAIVCSSCGRHYTEEEHEQYGRYLRAVAREANRKAKVAAA